MTESSITWSWTAVEGAIGYAVQVSHDEMFDATDQIVPTAETSFTASPLPPATSVFVRVAAAAGSLEAPLLSDWSTHVTGMTPAPDAPMPPSAPSGLQMSGATDTSITWSWDAVMSADGYEVQFNTEESFDGMDAVATTETSHTQMGLSEGTTGYLRVRSTAGDLASSWTAHLTAMTRVRPVTPSNLTATAGEGSITWTWDAVDGADSYHVQYSADGAFTDGGESMEVMEASYTKDGLGTGDTAYLRVRASGGTDDQARLLSGWSDPLRGMSATPMVPAVPSNLTATGGDGSITWTWDMVEGATGYQVQVSSTEDFSGAETMDVDGTSHTAEVAAGTTAYLRVRATGMGDPSGWATHVTGMSNAPAPEPEPEPDPVMVTFSLPDDESEFMEADNDDDEATAKASVNPDIMVTSNTTAVITPMFVDDANGVSISEGDNTPFTLVDWDMLQSAVLDGGATFMVQRTTVGANQMMEPSGDVAYVTCGPFACQDGSDAPEISIANSAACNAWDPELDLQIGRIDNDVVADDTDDTGNDGVDLGMVFKSSLAMKVKHSWSGVANGRNTDTTVDVGKSSTGATMGMNWVADVIRTDAGPDNDADEAGDNIDACDNTYAAATGSDSLFEPDGCFRALGPGPAKGAANYLSGWSIELQPQGAGVTWGRVDWDEDPFEDLECESMTMMVGDMVGTDVCDLFEAEVDYAVGDAEDWSPSVIFDTDNRVVRWQATAKNSADDTATPASTAGKFFKTLWFDDNLNGKIKDDGMADRSATGVTEVDSLHDLYNQNEDAGNLEWIWGSLRDADGDPNAGDLGKVDMVSEENDEDTDVDETATDDNFVHPDGIADNYPEGAAFEDSVRKCTEADGGDDDDGTICDANWSMTADVAFADGTFGCETTRSVTIKCTWDADGGITTGRGVALPQNFAAATNLANFLKCEAE